MITALQARPRVPVVPAAAAAGVPLSENAPLLRRIVDAAPDAILVFDAEGRIQFVNTVALRLFQLTENELLHSQLERLLAHNARAALAEQRADYLIAPHTVSLHAGQHWRLLLRSGTEIDADVGLAPTRVGSRLLVIATLRPRAAPSTTIIVRESRAG